MKGRSISPLHGAMVWCVACFVMLLGGCATTRMPVVETGPRTFQKIYDSPRRYGNYWTYNGIRGGYAYLVHYQLPPTSDLMRKVERMRCPVSALPPGFPTHTQLPIGQ